MTSQWTTHRTLLHTEGGIVWLMCGKWRQQLAQQAPCRAHTVWGAYGSPQGGSYYKKGVHAQVCTGFSQRKPLYEHIFTKTQ